jgi:hypothetical protein
MLKVTATDNVALAASPLGAWSNPPLQAQGFLLQANGPASVVASLMVPFPTDPTATPMVHFTARDLVGNSRNATWEAPPGWQATGCAQGMASLCPQSTEAKKSVGLEAGVLLLAVLALGLALRRRG